MGVGVLPGRMEGGVPVRGSTRGIGVAGVTAEVATEATPSDPLVAKRRDVHLDFFTLPPPPGAHACSSFLCSPPRCSETPHCLPYPPPVCVCVWFCVCVYAGVIMCVFVCEHMCVFCVRTHVVV